MQGLCPFVGTTGIITCALVHLPPTVRAAINMCLVAITGTYVIGIIYDTDRYTYEVHNSFDGPPDPGVVWQFRGFNYLWCAPVNNYVWMSGDVGPSSIIFRAPEEDTALRRLTGYSFFQERVRALYAERMCDMRMFNIAHTVHIMFPIPPLALRRLLEQMAQQQGDEQQGDEQQGEEHTLTVHADQLPCIMPPGVDCVSRVSPSPVLNKTKRSNSLFFINAMDVDELLRHWAVQRAVAQLAEMTAVRDECLADYTTRMEIWSDADIDRIPVRVMSVSVMRDVDWRRLSRALAERPDITRMSIGPDADVVRLLRAAFLFPFIATLTSHAFPFITTLTSHADLSRPFARAYLANEVAEEALWGADGNAEVAVTWGEAGGAAAEEAQEAMRRRRREAVRVRAAERAAVGARAGEVARDGCPAFVARAFPGLRDYCTHSLAAYDGRYSYPSGSNRLDVMSDCVVYRDWDNEVEREMSSGFSVRESIRLPAATVVERIVKRYTLASFLYRFCCGGREWPSASRLHTDPVDVTFYLHDQFSALPWRRVFATYSNVRKLCVNTHRQSEYIATVFRAAAAANYELVECNMRTIHHDHQAMLAGIRAIADLSPARLVVVCISVPTSQPIDVMRRLDIACADVLRALHRLRIFRVHVGARSVDTGPHPELVDAINQHPSLRVLIVDSMRHAFFRANCPGVICLTCTSWERNAMSEEMLQVSMEQLRRFSSETTDYVLK